MVQDFRKKGIETVLISQPFVLTNSKNFTEARQKHILATSQFQKTYIIDDFWFGQTAILDIFKPQTQAWYWTQYKRLISQGAMGVWGDLGEPEKHPDGIFHLDGKLKAQEAHNIYGHYWAKTVYEGFKRDFPKVRPFILMRSGFAGSQRFGLIPWSGDVAHSWKGFRGQPALALSMGLCGVGYMHADAGGFAGGEKDDELYIRWLQYSLFQPIFRPHCQEKIPSEPVFYDEPTKSIAREIVKWRYRLLPYNQTLAYENSKTGKPLMRPLFVAEPDNKELCNIADTYLWGRDLLVAPVFEQGATSRKVYLTKGDIWYDFFSSERHEGGKWIEAKLDRQNMGYFPVFVRGGACLLTMPDDRLAQKYATDVLNITLFVADKNSQEEEVESNFYLEKADENGAIIEAGFIKCEAEKKGELELEAFVPKDLQIAGNPFLTKKRTISLTIKGLDKMPASVTLNGKNLAIIQMQEARKGDGYWHLSEKTLQFTFDWQAGKEVEIAWK
jgi:oligosaccharide 4-alpha-D-glucosyltransferase